MPAKTDTNIASDAAQARNAAADWNPIATVLVSAAAGPPIGLLLLLAALGIFGGIEKASTDGFWLPLLALNPIMWLLAYILTGVPALLAGIAYAALDRFAPRRVPRIALAIATGLSVMLGYWLTIGGATGSIGMLGATGAATGGVIAWLTRRWQYRPHA